MADVCDLAHRRTKQSLKNYNLFHGTKHKLDKENKDGEISYPAKAQQIFNAHYDHICEVTGI